jgi:hypothetical protein
MPKAGSNLNISFSGFVIGGFSIAEPIKPPNKLDFDISKSVGFPKENMLAVRVLVNIHDQSNKENPICTASTISYFTLSESLFSLKNKKGNIQIPWQVLRTITSVSISTTRGVIIAKGSGTLLGGIIIPLFDSGNLVPSKDVIIPIKEFEGNLKMTSEPNIGNSPENH